MAICNVIDDPGRSVEEYERITAQVRDSGPVPPEGCRLILVSRERAITVWDSPADRDRFLARIEAYLDVFFGEYGGVAMTPSELHAICRKPDQPSDNFIGQSGNAPP